MRHKRSLQPEYFEGIFAGSIDPWEFETSAYEKAKHDHTIAVLSGARYQRGLEIGCATGVLTTRLGTLCDTLLAIDVSSSALTQAQARCADQTHIGFQQMNFPTSTPTEAAFDLIVISEVAYYWDDRDLALAGRWLGRNLAPGGSLLLVHFTGETDYPQTADGAVEGLRQALGDRVEEADTTHCPGYRLDLWRRRPWA
jgi:predicted TPR repeat methyltransferase